MKILIINTLYSPYKIGGAEVSVQLLSEELVKQGNEVSVFTLHPKFNIEKKIINGVIVVYFPLMNKYWPFGEAAVNRVDKILWHLKDIYNHDMLRMVEKEITVFSPDVIHTNNLAGFSVGIWNSIKREGFPLIHTTRDYYLFHPNATLFKDGKNISVKSISVRLSSFYKKYISRKVDVMVGISQYISQLHKENKFASKAIYSHIYNPIDTIKINKEKNNEKITVGFIGRLTTEKGFDVFIEYAKKYRNEMSFIAAGRATTTKDSIYLTKRAREAGVSLKGFIPVDEFFSEVDALLLPTKWNEPFGRVVAEAALAGIPVFTNLRGGVIEIAENFKWVCDMEMFSAYEVKNMMNFANSESEIINPFVKRIVTEKYMELYLLAIEFSKKGKNHEG